LEQPADFLGAFAPFRQLLLDDENLEPCEPVDLQLEDGIGLLGVELEPRHDLFGGVGLAVRFPDDFQNLVKRVENRLEAFEDVNALVQRLELELEPRADDFESEMQKLPE